MLSEGVDESIPVALTDDEKWPVLPYRSHICDISGVAARLCLPAVGHGQRRRCRQARRV